VSHKSKLNAGLVEYQFMMDFHAMGLVDAVGLSAGSRSVSQSQIATKITTNTPPRTVNLKTMLMPIIIQ
jgi:hypothetical protein